MKRFAILTVAMLVVFSGPAPAWSDFQDPVLELSGFEPTSNSPPGPAFDPPGPPFDPPGSVFDPPGPPFDPPGPPFDPPGSVFDPPGSTFDPPGPPFDPPGSVIDPLGLASNWPDSTLDATLAQPLFATAMLTSVPEPSTLALAIIGLLVLLATRSRRRR